jgi:hypothetical protein
MLGGSSPGPGFAGLRALGFLKNSKREVVYAPLEDPCERRTRVLGMTLSPVSQRHVRRWSS